MAQRTVTISDIAKEAQVSKSAVSIALRNKTGISQDTRNRILDIVQKTGYSPSINLQNHGKKYFGQIGLLMFSGHAPRINNELGSSYLHSMVSGAMAHAEKASVGLGVCTMTIKDLCDEKLPMMLRRPSVDGWVIRGPYMPELQKILESLHEPYVLVESDRYVPEVPQIQIENTQAMINIAEHLLGCGAKKIATISGDMDHINAQERLAGLQIGLLSHGSELSTDRIVLEHDFDEESGRRGMKTLLERSVEFDAVVCHNDLIASGAMAVLADNGLVVGKDVLVTGFDNMAFASRLSVPLTTVDSQPFAMAGHGVDLLSEHIHGEHTLYPVHMKWPAKLVIRESTQGTQKRPADSYSETHKEVDAAAGCIANY